MGGWLSARDSGPRNPAERTGTCGASSVTTLPTFTRIGFTNSLGKDTPNRRPVENQPCREATVISSPRLGVSIIATPGARRRSRRFESQRGPVARPRTFARAASMSRLVNSLRQFTPRGVRIRNWQQTGVSGGGRWSNFGGVRSGLGLPLAHRHVRVGGNVGKNLPRSRRPLDFDAVRASAAAQSEMHGRLARAGITG